MGSLLSRIENDMKEALKAREETRLSVLRMIIASVRNVEIEKNLKTVDDPEVVKILQKSLKQHRESIAQFEKGNRPDLVAKESAELKFIEVYLPKQMTEEDLTMLVKAVIAETGASQKSDTGKVMKAVMAKAQGQADGKAISSIVAALLK